MKEISVLIADDHPMIIKALKRAFHEHSYFQVIGVAGNGAALIELVNESPSDIAIIDLEMPKTNGYDTILELHTRFPKIKTIAYSGYLSSINQQRAINMGAVSTISKTESIDNFIVAVEATAAGHSFHSKTDDQIIAKPVKNNKDSILTLREKQILNLIAVGKTSKQISEIYHISRWTVDKHRSNIKEKLGISTLAEMIRYAISYDEVPKNR